MAFSALSLPALAVDLSESIHCSQPRTSSSVIRYTTHCDSKGQLLEVRGHFKRTGQLSYIDERVDSNRRRRQTFNGEGQITSNFEIEELGDNLERWLEVNSSTGKLRTDRTLEILDPSRPINNRLVSRRRDHGDQMQLEDHFNKEGLVVERQIFLHEDFPAGMVHFTYQQQESGPDDLIQAYTYYDDQGDVIADLSIPDTPAPEPLPNERPWASMVIDTGFDTTHPDIASHVAFNPNEPVDGIDNDENGFVDDGAGWNFHTRSAKLLEPLYTSQDEVFPYSHGTHVASIAFEGVKKFRFLGVSGESQAEALVVARKYILRDQVRFVNMSFAWDGNNRGMTPGAAATTALTNLVQRSPNTLFIVAAGNRPIELIHGQKDCDLPACLKGGNVIRVAAADVASFDDEDLAGAGLAEEFSSFSETLVDLAAPGVGVMGALAGGGRVPMTGTSMAAPLVNNLLMKMVEINPRLSNAELTEVLLKTVYIPDIDQPLPVRSGGMAFPRRCLRVVESLKENPAGTIEDHILQVRLEPNMLLGQESNRAKELATLRKLWQRVDEMLPERPQDSLVSELRVPGPQGRSGQ